MRIPSSPVNGSSSNSEEIFVFVRLPPLPCIKIKFIIESGYTPPKGFDRAVLKFGRGKIDFDGIPGGEYTLELSLNESGTFLFGIVGINSIGTIQIPPRISLQRQQLAPDQFVLQTVISKWMGTLSDWDCHLKAAAHAGFNWIHFTPLQRRGLSNSPYSLYDHLQFSPDLFDSSMDSSSHDDLITRKIQWMAEDVGLLSMIDVVWNHISCDSPHLPEHPEIGYNLENSPHLQAAFDLDELILKFSRELENFGLQRKLECEEDLQRLLFVFQQHILPEAALWEYFTVDISQAVRELEMSFRREALSPPSSPIHSLQNLQLSPIPCSDLADALVDDGKFSRSSHRMDLRKVTGYYCREIEDYRRIQHEGDRSIFISRILADYRNFIDRINYPRYAAYDEKIQRVIANLANRIRYERLDFNGPRLGPITEQSPLVATYFTRFKCFAENGRSVACVNNGWIWNADPMVNFAEAGSDAYFTRDVIVWGDCVKLRYGSNPADSPWLWSYMVEYTEKMAKIFHGFRIDNCHSTPIHVAEYLLSRARQVRPELYVCAELFTPSEERDLIYVKRLGLNSLIREAMVAWDVPELSRLARKYGGQVIGHPLIRPEYQSNPADEKMGVASSFPHTLFMDCSHDNEMPAQKRTALDTLPNAAIVAFCSAAHGSVCGYDDLFPRHVNIVSETRRYPKPGLNDLWEFRKELSIIHQKIFGEHMVLIDAFNLGDLLIIAKYNPKTWRGLLLLAKTAFKDAQDTSNIRNRHFFNQFASIFVDFDDIDLKGFTIAKPILAATMHSVSEEDNQVDRIPTMRCVVDFQRYYKDHSDVFQAPKLSQLSQGSIFIAELQLVVRIEENSIDLSAAYSVIQKLDLYDLNILLFRCAAEENDEKPPKGTYCIPSFGCLPYGGLAGFIILFNRMRKDPAGEDHPLWQNVRDGDWAIEYLFDRIARPHYPNLLALRDVLYTDVLPKYKKYSPLVKPFVYMEIIQLLYDSVIARSRKLLTWPKIMEDFSASLALTSVQLVGLVDSTGLHPKTATPSLSAGLPHFATHHMRCWGRDTFIALNGLFLVTGRFKDAHRHLIAYASCYYHGLIPNLLDSARRPRYNARDATWWFLHALQAYCSMAPKGMDILDEQVPLRFPNDIYIDFDDPSIFSRSISLKEVVQRIMQSHAQGIYFREWNAGPALDPVMHDQGFNIHIRLDRETGFICGGNAFNCGTWMDKMGESEKAGNRGIPATPRDGAAIELVALLAETLDWLIKFNPTGNDGVYLEDGTYLSYQYWRQLIQENFEQSFYIPTDEDEGEKSQCDETNHKTKMMTMMNGSLLHRGIYKDTFRATDSRRDFQFRPNMAVAMAICPSLFKPQHALVALSMVEKYLLGPLGMRTLSPLDPDYRPYYDNSNDSADWHIARGFNYHQGPEWLWPMGFYLQACLHFRSPCQSYVIEKLRPLAVHLRTSSYAGLAELTNRNGEFCQDSCSTQAWSSATILEVLYRLDSL